MPFKRLLSEISVLFLGCQFLFAQGSSISIDSNVDKSTILSGDRIRYTIVVTRTPDVEVEMPALAENLGTFEIEDYQIYDPQSSQDKVIDRFEYTIVSYDPGELEIPPLDFHYMVPGDSTKHALTTKTLQITVESRERAESDDIDDISLPEAIARNLREILLWGGLGLVALVAAGVGFYVWRRKRAGKGLLPEKVAPPRPAHEVALEQLNALKESSLLQDGKVKQYYIAISDIIRRYVEGRYFIVAIELTTFELVQELEKASVEAESVHAIQKFLEFCDLAKFAKYIPTSEENESSLTNALEIVEKTKLVFDQPAESAETSEETVATAETPEEEEPAGNNEILMDKAEKS
jgi:hypothetical protein